MVEVCEAPLMTCVPQNQVVALRADRGVSLTWKNVRRVRFSSCGRLSFIHVNVQLYWAWHRTSGISWRCCSCSNSEIASSKILLRCHLFTHTHVNGTCFTYGAHSSQNVRGSRQTTRACLTRIFLFNNTRYTKFVVNPIDCFLYSSCEEFGSPDMRCTWNMQRTRFI